MDGKEWERKSDRIRKNVPNKVVFDIQKRRQSGGGNKWKPLWSGALQLMSYEVYEGKTCYAEGGVKKL